MVTLITSWVLVLWLVSCQLTIGEPVVEAMLAPASAWPVTVIVWVTAVIAWASLVVLQAVARGCWLMVTQFGREAVPTLRPRAPGAAFGSTVTARGPSGSVGRRSGGRHTT